MTNIEKIIFENKFKIKVSNNIMTVEMLYPNKIYHQKPYVNINILTYSELVKILEELVYISEEEFVKEYSGRNLK